MKRAAVAKGLAMGKRAATVSRSRLIAPIMPGDPRHINHEIS
jgi:hypothetical protein